MNKALKRYLIGLLLLSGVSAAWAAAKPFAVAEIVQAPVWVERDGIKLALVPGQEVRNKDRIETGEGARLVLRLAEGSTVKLGEKAELKLDAMGRQASEKKGRKVFTAALDVVTGAFRFTTLALKRSFRDERAVNIRVQTITAGIRGTDVWGKSDGKRDLVCLLEGKVTVKHDKADEPVMLNEPLSFYAADKDKAAEQATVDVDQVKKWAAETEPQAGKGVLNRKGRWQVLAAVYDNQEEAIEMYDRLRLEGYPAKVKAGIAPAESSFSKREYAYQVRVPGFATQADAETAANRLKTTVKAYGAKAVNR